MDKLEDKSVGSDASSSLCSSDDPEASNMPTALQE